MSRTRWRRRFLDSAAGELGKGAGRLAILVLALLIIGLAKLIA